MKLKDIIGSMASKFAALALAFVFLCASGAWGAGASLTSSGATMTPVGFRDAIAEAVTAASAESPVVYDGQGVTVDFDNAEIAPAMNHSSDGLQFYILGDQNSSPAKPVTVKNVKFSLTPGTYYYEGKAYTTIQLYLYAKNDVSFENCVFVNVGLSMNGATNPAATGYFTDCTFENVDGYGLKYFRNLVATRCLFDGCKRAMFPSCSSLDASDGTFKAYETSTIIKIDGCRFVKITKDRIIKFYNLFTDANTTLAIINNVVDSSSTASFITCDFDAGLTPADYPYTFTFTGNTGVTSANLNASDTEKTLYISGNALVDVEPVAAVAKIGTTEYATLAEAIADAQNGNTIELLDNIDLGTITNPGSSTGAVTIPSGKTVTLDLAGHKISVALNTNDSTYYNANVLLVRGNLTVEDTSAEKTGEFINTYNNSYPCTRAVRVMSGGTLTMNGGTVTATTGEAMRVDGTATLNAGVTVQAIQSANYGGWDNAVAGIELRGNATLTVNGAVVRSIGRAAIYSDAANNVITLNNGVFAGSVEHGAIYGSKAQESVFVKGGYYSSDPTDFINPQQYYAALVSEGDYAGYYFVGTIAPVLSTVTTKEELAAALATSTPQAPAYVTVSGDIIIDTSVELPFGATLTVPNGSALRVVDNGVLINKGEITSEGTIAVTGTGFLSNPSSVNGVISGCTFEADETNKTIEWVVETPMDLQWISWICNQKDGSDYAYSTYTWDVKVANDITFPVGVEFEKIPQFTGVFDGQGHKINNLVLRATSDRNAMFLILQNATVLNTEITATVETVSGYTGTLADRTYGKVRIDGVKLNGTMTATGATYGIAPFVAMPSNAGTLAHLYIGNSTNNMTVSAVNGWNTSPVCGTTANADWYGGKLGVYNFVNNGSAVCSETSAGYVVGYSMSPNLTIEVINYVNNGSASTQYSQIPFDCTKYETFCYNSGAAWSNPVFDLTYASTDHTAYYHEDEDIYNTEPPPAPPVAAIANDETVLDMWSFWWMEGMVDAENNPCPQYVSITDETLYRDLGVKDENAEEAWVSAKYLYDNYLADGKPSASNAKYFVYEPGALTTKYVSLQDAFDAAVDGDTIELLTDVELDSYVNLDKQGTYVIDGAGHTISMADGATFDGRGIFGFGPAGITEPYSVAADKNYTLKNVTVTGFDAEIVRCEGVSLTFDNCVFINNNITQELGRGKVLLRIASSAITVTNCKFTDNSAFNGIYIDEQTTAAATININGNLFSGNTISGNGIVQVATAASESDAIVGNTFSGNTLESSENVAVLYISAPVEDVSGNLFSGNTITTAASKKEGVIVLGGSSTGTGVNGNAFVDNTLGTTASHYATIYTGADCNISGNYWGDGNAAEIDDHKDVYDSGTHTIANTTYATAYAVNANGRGVTVTIYVPPVAQIGDTEYMTLAAALTDVTKDAPLSWVSDTVWPSETPVYYNGNFYATLNAAVVAANAANSDESALIYCRPGAAVSGTLHEEMTTSIAIFGNNAHLNCYSGTKYQWDVTFGNPGKDLSIRVYNLHDGLYLWGNHTADKAVNVEIANCENMYEYYLYPKTGSGRMNVAIRNCSFDFNRNSYNLALWFLIPGTYVVEGCTFSNFKTANKIPVQLETEAATSFVVKDCVFTDCVPNGGIALVRAIADAETVAFALDNVAFNDENSSYDIDISYPHASCAGVVNFEITPATEAKLRVFTSGSTDVKYTATIAANETHTGDNDVLRVAQIGDVTYETFAAAIQAAEEYAAAHDGTYPTITVLDDTAEIGNDDWKISNGNLVKKNYVAQIVRNDMVVAKYETLAEALANAADGDTVTMLDNVTLTEPLNVTLGNKAVVLDLGGKTLAGRTNLKSGSLTIQNGTVAGGSAQALNVYGSADTTATNYSVLTIASDVTVTADVYGVCMFGATAGSNGYGAVVNIAGNVTTTGDGKNGAVFVSGNLGQNVSDDAHNVIKVTGKITSETDAAIAMNGLATVNVSAGATVTGDTAIAVKRGTLNVTDGTIHATGAKNYTAAAYYNGTEMTGAAISVSATYSQYGALAVNVSGGTVTSDNADPIFKQDGTYQSDATVAVSGGYFSSAVSADYCATDYLCTTAPMANGYYQVVPAATVTFDLGEGAPDGAAAPVALTYPSGNPAETALPKPTYTSTVKTFAGWKVNGEGDAVSALPAGTTGDVTLVATWTAAAKVEVEIGEGTEAAKVEVVIPEQFFEDKTDEIAEAGGKSEYLETSDANGLKKWQNYVMGIDGSKATNKLAPIGGEPKSERIVVVKTPVETFTPPTADTGVTVKYALYWRAADSDTWTQYGDFMDAPTFGVDIVGDITAAETYWKIEAVFTASSATATEASGASEESQESGN